MRALFAVEFQRKILKYLIDTRRSEVFEYLDEKFFDEFETKEIVRYIGSIIKTGHFPTTDEIRLHAGGLFVDQKELSEEKKKVLLSVDQILSLTIDKDEVAGLLSDFLKVKRLSRLISEMRIDHQTGVHEISRYIKELGEIEGLKVDADDGMIFTESGIYINPREKVPTHLPTLNTWLQGGLMRGELGLAMGQTGIGKTFLLTNFAAAAFRLGMKVFYYSFEISAPHIKLRLDTNISGFSEEEIDRKRSKFTHRMEKANRGGEIIIKDYPPRTVSVSTIQAHMRMIKAKYGYKPDLILIDYLDLMKAIVYTGNDWLDLGEICGDLRRVGQEMDAAVWTVSQINLGAYDKSFGLAAIRRSAEKIHIADVVIGMWQPEADQAKLEMNLLKIRRARRSGGKISVALDFDRGTMKELEQTGKPT